MPVAIHPDYVSRLVIFLQTILPSSIVLIQDPNSKTNNAILLHKDILLGYLHHSHLYSYADENKWGTFITPRDFVYYLLNKANQKTFTKTQYGSLIKLVQVALDIKYDEHGFLNWYSLPKDVFDEVYPPRSEVRTIGALNCHVFDRYNLWSISQKRIESKEFDNMFLDVDIYVEYQEDKDEHQNNINDELKKNLIYREGGDILYYIESMEKKTNSYFMDFLHKELFFKIDSVLLSTNSKFIDTYLIRSFTEKYNDLVSKIDALEDKSDIDLRLLEFYKNIIININKKETSVIHFIFECIELTLSEFKKGNYNDFVIPITNVIKEFNIKDDEDFITFALSNWYAVPNNDGDIMMNVSGISNFIRNDESYIPRQQIKLYMEYMFSCEVFYRRIIYMINDLNSNRVRQIKQGHNYCNSIIINKLENDYSRTISSKENTIKKYKSTITTYEKQEVEFSKHIDKLNNDLMLIDVKNTKHLIDDSLNQINTIFTEYEPVIEQHNSLVDQLKKSKSKDFSKKLDNLKLDDKFLDDLDIVYDKLKALKNNIEELNVKTSFLLSNDIMKGKLRLFTKEDAEEIKKIYVQKEFEKRVLPDLPTFTLIYTANYKDSVPIEEFRGRLKACKINENIQNNIIRELQSKNTNTVNPSFLCQVMFEEDYYARIEKIKNIYRRGRVPIKPKEEKVIQQNQKEEFDEFA